MIKRNLVPKCFINVNPLKSIPFLSLSFQHAQIDAAIRKVLMDVYQRSHFVLGEELQRFEEEYATFSGTTFCAGVGNGLDALSLALLSCNLSPDDEVIVPANTYIATWLAVSRCGARIIPVEPDDKTLNIDISKIENAITKKTKVIIPVHLYGQACDMTSIKTIAVKHNLLIVEDNAQAHGASWAGKRTGLIGDINATSFYPTKNLGCLGDGGAVTTSDPEKVAFVKRYRNYGFETKNIATELGANSRLDEIQAAVLRIKLRHLDQWNQERQTLAALYNERLKNVGDIILPYVALNAEHVYHLFVVRTAHRDRLKVFLSENGIDTMVHYPIPPHLQKAYHLLNFKKGDFPITERSAETILSLPLWPGLTNEQIDLICDTIKNFFS